MGGNKKTFDQLEKMHLDKLNDLLLHSTWIPAADPPKDQESVLIYDKKEDTYGVGYYHGPRSGFISHTTGVYEVYAWKPIIKYK